MADQPAIRRIFNSIVADLEKYEVRHQMASENFYAAFQSGQINEEREEFYDWRSKYSAYRHMCQRFGLSR